MHKLCHTGCNDCSNASTCKCELFADLPGGCSDSGNLIQYASGCSIAALLSHSALSLLLHGSAVQLCYLGTILLRWPTQVSWQLKGAHRDTTAQAASPLLLSTHHLLPPWTAQRSLNAPTAHGQETLVLLTKISAVSPLEPHAMQPL